MNRKERRTLTRDARRGVFDFARLAKDYGLPIDIVKTMQGTLRGSVTKELCPANRAPAFARVNPTRAAKWVNAFVDSWFGGPKDEPIACQAGCSHCCFIVPTITVGETTILRAAISRLPEVAQQQIATNMVAAAETVRVAGSAGAAWPLRCPLLGPDNLCQVYQDRPSNCRAWASKDVAPCMTMTDDIPIPMQTRLARTSLAFLDDIFGQIYRPLPLALEEAP